MLTLQTSKRGPSRTSHTCVSSFRSSGADVVHGSLGPHSASGTPTGLEWAFLNDACWV